MELWPAQDFSLGGDNYITKTGLSLLHGTCLLVLLFISTKHYQNMSKGIKVMACTRFPVQDFGFRGDNYLTNKVTVVSLAHDTPTGPLHPYQILSNYLKQYGSYGLQKISASGEISFYQTVRVVALALDIPTGLPIHSYQILPNRVRISNLRSAQG